MAENETPKCTGQCCERLPLPDLEIGLITMNPAKYGFGNDPLRIAESQIVAQMAIPTGASASEGRSYYNCRHYDSKAKRCGIYDRRPGMCRDFPYTKEIGNVCEFCGAKDSDKGNSPGAWERRKNGEELF